MELSEAELKEFCGRAEHVARRGGEVLLRHVGPSGDAVARSKGRRRELVTDADRAAEECVVGGLMSTFPEHAYLAEEGVLTPPGRPSNDSDFVWVVDPLDGTTNFVHGLPFYAVAIALVWRGTPVVGVVHAPALQTTFLATRGGGAVRDGATLRVSDTGDLSDALVATGFSYNRNEEGRDDNVERLRRLLPECRDLRRLGCAQLDLCMTAAGHFDAYWELYLMPYDVAAGAVVVREAGGRVTDLCGGEDWLFGGQLLVSNGRLHDQVLRRVGGAPPPAPPAGH
jgi:myo-inositol-1(or 4)-monophosphatase